MGREEETDELTYILMVTQPKFDSTEINENVKKQ